MASIWRLTTPDAPPSIRDWEGDFVVYNPLSGDTHMLDIVSGETLKALSAGAIAEEDLRAHIANFLEVPNDATLLENLRRILAHLDELGLIEPAGI